MRFILAVFASFLGSSRTLAMMALAVVSATLGHSARAAQAVAPCYGPVTFVRTPGDPQTFDESFPTPNLGAPYIVRVRNGDRDRAQRIDGVAIDLNGVSLFLGDEISAASPIVERVFFADRRDNALSLLLSGEDAGLILVDVRPYAGAAPFVDAGVDRSVQVGELVTLDLTVSRVAANAITAFDWQFVSRPSGSSAVLSGASTPQASFEADVAGAYRVRALVSAAGLSSAACVTIQALGSGNLPPIPDAGLNQSIELGASALLDGSASFDPEGQPLSYSWTLGGGPPGNNAQLLNANTVSPTFIPDLVGMYVISLTVNDGQLDSVVPDRTRITVSPFNGDPIADAGPDQSVSVGATVQLDGSGSSDPENQPLAFDWAFTSIPPGSAALLDDPADPTPTFVADAPGAYVVRLIVFDGLEFSVPDEVVVTAASGQVTVPNVVGLAQGAAQDALLAAGLSVGSLTAVQSAAFSPGQVAAQTPVAGTSVPPATPVNLDISIGGGVDILPPNVSVVCSPTVVDIGENVLISVTASDNVGVTSLTLTVNGAPVALDVNGNASFVPSAAGLFEARAAASDASGLTSSDRAYFSARSAVDNGAPVVALTSPVEDATLRDAVAVIGTASDTDLTLFELQLAPAASSQFVTFATGTTSVTASTLGRLVPGAFAPGVYDLRVCANDSWGNSACSPSVRVELDAVKRAPGYLSFAFLDGFVDVVGLPISVRRVYDGADKTVGDFGVGWRLDTDSVKLETTRQMGADWQIQKVGTIFPTYFLNPSKDHRVNVFLPDGTAHRFRMRPDPSSQQLVPIDFLNGAFFDALAGTTSTLTPNDQPCFVQPVLNSSGPVQLFDCSVELYNPSGYTLDLADGRTLTFVQDGSPLRYRLATLRDSNNNVITFGVGGISHSAGAGVSWTRDGLGRITALTNPNGDTRTYSYDARGDLTEVTDFAGNATQFVYDEAHNLVRVIDPRGFTPGTLIYNEAGQIVAMIDPDGNRVEISYDTVNNQQIVTDRLGNTTIFSFDAAGNLIATTNALGESTSFTYDTDGRMLTRTDPLGAVHAFTYDSDGRLLTETDALGGTTARSYDANGNLISTTDRLGQTTSLTYDSDNNLTQVIGAGGAAYQFAYRADGELTQTTLPGGATVTLGLDTAGNVTSFTDPLGRQTQLQHRPDGQPSSRSFVYGGQTVQYGWSYDANGRLVGAQLPDGTSGVAAYDPAGLPASAVNSLGDQQQTVYDPQGAILSFQDFDGGVTAVSRDAEGRLLSLASPGGLTVTRTLDATGRPTNVMLANGATVGMVYDSAGRIASQQRAGEGPFLYTRDLLGRVTHVTAPDGGVSVNQYDAAGQLTSATNPLGHTTLFQYDPSGNIARTTLPDGAQIETEYDQLERMTAMEDPLGTRIEYAWDAADQLTAVTDSAGGVTTYTYDTMGNLVTAATPGGSQWSLQYNTKGQLIGQTYPWGGMQSRGLDAYGRLTLLTDPSGQTAGFEYDPAGRLTSTLLSSGPPETRNYDASGQLTQVEEPGRTTALSYGGDGMIDRVDYPDGSFVAYTYDAAGRRASLQTASGTTSYTYDANGRLGSVNDSLLGATHYHYDLAGRVSSVDSPDGSTTSVVRDLRGAVTGLTTAVGGNVLRNSAYIYDPSGKLLQITEVGRTVQYQYDAAGRLASELRTGLDAGSDAYAFDLDWSLTQSGSRVLSYDGTMRLVSDGVFSLYTYDAAGRPTSRANASSAEQFFYDARGQLVRMERTGAAAAIVNIDYDHAGLIRRVETNGQVRTLLWDTVDRIPRLLEERDASGSLLRRYVYADSLLGIWDGAAHVVHGDPTGSVRFITNASGAIEETYAFKAYGEQTAGGALTSLRFAGELFVPELGLYFLRTRFYDPLAGRFLTPDQLDPHAGVSLTWNPYQYGNGNPVSFRDPMGTFSIGGLSVAVSIAGILAGIALQAYPSALELVVSGLFGTPPGNTRALGGQVSVGAILPVGSGGFGASFNFTLSIVGGHGVYRGMFLLETGLSWSSPVSAVLRSVPNIAVSAAAVFGQDNGPPGVPPQPSVSLQISGGGAAKVMGQYFESVRDFHHPAVRTLKMRTSQQAYRNGSAAISIGFGPPPDGELWEVFAVGASIDVTNSGVGSIVRSLIRGVAGSARYRATPTPWGGLSVGLALTASFPIFYVTYDSMNGLESGWGDNSISSLY